jgi:ankyrin repeat protein
MFSKAYIKKAEGRGKGASLSSSEPLLESPEKREQNSRLIAAVRGNDINDIVKAMSKGASANARDIDGSTALMIAAEEGNIDLCRLLIKKGADIEAKWINIDVGLGTLETALITAAKHGKKDVCALLLEKGANPNATDRYKTTALMYAAQFGYPEVCTVLLEHKANPRLKDKNFMTALKLSRNGAGKAIQEHLAHFKG